MSRTERLLKGLLKVGELAKEARLRPSTVRFYTLMGLLPVAGSTPGGYRLYKAEEAIARLGVIREMVEPKPSLTEVRDVLNKTAWEVSPQ